MSRKFIPYNILLMEKILNPKKMVLNGNMVTWIKPAIHSHPWYKLFFKIIVVIISLIQSKSFLCIVLALTSLILIGSGERIELGFFRVEAIFTLNLREFIKVMRPLFWIYNASLCINPENWFLFENFIYTS